jgi:hypothetical protein
VLRWFALWTALALAWSWLFGEVDAAGWEVAGGVANAAALLLFLAVCRLSAPRWADLWVQAYVAIGVLVVALSFAVCYGRWATPFPAGRLRDVLVFAGGLHPVLTGLLAAWGMVAASALAARGRNRRSGWLAAVAVLAAGCCYSHSRGAMLAAAAGMAALLLTAGWRRWGPPAAVVAGVAAAYLFVVPPLASRGRAAAAPTPPARELVTRGDNGRLALYRFLWSEVEGVPAHLAGRGVWADRAAGPPDLFWSAPHPHSAYFATYLAGGALGAAVVATVLASGLLRGWRSRRAEGGLWTPVLACGAVGLAFDGDLLVALWTTPRVEPLLFWLPWAALSPGGPRSAD